MMTGRRTTDSPTDAELSREVADARAEVVRTAGPGDAFSAGVLAVLSLTRR